MSSPSLQPQSHNTNSQLLPSLPNPQGQNSQPSFHYRPPRPTTPSPRDPAIRHAGRAHIRGKIRRVWRPRYLELCDTGLVRYYELPPTADVTLPEDSDWDHVNMIPKDTLVIYHARIIDVTTLRDLHVGLPKGSYGFLFRGQRVGYLELQPQNEPPREYFCAVSTLEEAQTWVIVLQWAASVCKATHQQTMQDGDYSSDRINFLGDSCHIPSVTRTTSSKPVILEPRTMRTMTTTATFNNKKEEAWLDSSSAGSIGAATANTADSSPAVLVTNNKPKKVGRIVVTKVEDFQIVRVPASSPAASLLLLQWQVAYKLDLLLIQGTKVEERRILRTAHDFVRLLDELSRELDSKISLTLIDEWRSQLLLYPLPPVALQDYPTSDTNHILPRIVKSFPLLNKLLRALAMDANIVNSNALKKCFVLDTENPILAPIEWWKTMTPHQFERSLLLRRTIMVPEDDTDAFVKKWLASKQPLSDNWQIKTWFWILQRPWMVVGGTGLGLALSIPLARVYQQAMVSITLRMDVLMGSWCLAAYLGKEYWGTTKKGGLLRSQPAAVVRPVLPRPQLTVATTTHPEDSFARGFQSTVVVTAPSSVDEILDTSSVDSKDDLDYLEHHGDEDEASVLVSRLSSPLPQWPQNNGESCWSSPPDNSIFRVRGASYLEDRVKIPSGPSPFKCRGVDVWLTDNPERHIARHPSVLNGKLHEEDTFLVNFLLPFGNFVSYFTVPPLSEFPDKLATVWSKFVKGDQQYRDKRLKLLPVVMDGPWIVRAAVGNGTAPALLGKVIPLQYYFHDAPSATTTNNTPSSQSGANNNNNRNKKAIYEVDVIITASSIAKGILSVVKGHTKSLTIAFAFIIEASEQEELPETVLCAFQVHQLHLEDCPHLPPCNLDEIP